jgi:peptide/nickel transport system ATP-binding protein
MKLAEQAREGVRADGLTIAGPAGDIVRNLSFSIPLGQTLGIVGESGSGKSLTAKAVSGLLPAGLRTTGSVMIAGSEVLLPGTAAAWQRLRGPAVTLLLQDPFTSLSPTHRCGDQIAWTLRAKAGRARLPRAEIQAQITQHLYEVNLPATVARQYPGELSGGMRQRVAIAAALAAGPRLLIADEPTTALDASNQRDVLDLLAGLQREHGMAMVLISHDLGLVRGVADRVLVMYAGSVVEQGPTAAVLGTPVHPYTAGLRASDPPMDRRLERLVVIPGRVPEPGQRSPGCSFADRCALVVDACRVAEPPLQPVADGRLVACFVSSGPVTELAPAVVEERWERDTDAQAVIEIQGLTKTFRGHPALREVSIEVRDGESVGIVGESGSGKTTLARCIVGLERPDTGHILFRGTPLTRHNRTANQVQVVFQDPYSALNPRMRVGAALAEALGAGAAAQHRAPQELLEMVGLPAAFARRYPAELSGGERQRVAIARSLAPAPDLLICDESVSALDVSVQAQILNLLADLRRQLGLTILFISHDLAVIRQISDAIYVISGGRIVESGLTREVLHAPQQDYTRRLISAVAGDAALPRGPTLPAHSRTAP